MQQVTSPRVGVVVPSANAAVEAELRCLLAGQAQLHAARYPTFPGSDLRERLDHYRRFLPVIAGDFGRMPLDAMVAACSGHHYLEGPATDARACLALTERLGVPFISVTRAVVLHLEHCGIDRVVLGSPYAPWLTELSESYWRAAGIAVEQIVPIRCAAGFAPYEVRPEDIIRAFDGVTVPRGAAVLFTGTGMFTLEAAAELRRARGWRCVSSNLSSAWWALRTVGDERGLVPDDRSEVAA